MYVEKFIIFNIKRLTSKTKPKLSKLIPIIVGIEVNKPVRIKIFEIITFFVGTKLKISFL